MIYLPLALQGRWNRLSRKITYEVHPGADGVWYIVSKQDFKSYAPTSCTVASCEFGFLVFAEGFPDTVLVLDEVDGLRHLQEVVEAGLRTRVEAVGKEQRIGRIAAEVNSLFA